MDRIILHVDMDAFFASVEMREHPEWRERPVIVGSGPHERGVVSTCNYAARKYGVHSAMPSRTAYAKCPTAVFVHPHMELYEEVSSQVFEIFAHYTPTVEGVSIDEAFLDITGSIRSSGKEALEEAVRLGERLRAEVRSVCGVTCSVGIAPNRLLAKIGSETKKPDGLTLMPFESEAIAEFLAPRPIGILWGIGEKTRAVLSPYGIKTCGDLQRIDTAELAAVLGSEENAEHLKAHAFGIADDTVTAESGPEQSVSREYTFDEDESDREKIRLKLLELVAEVGHRFRSEERWALTARIKIRESDFTTRTRQTAFDHPSCDDFSFRKKALELFDREELGAIRLIGFGVTNIVNSPVSDSQPMLFATDDDARREKMERLSRTLDGLRDRGLM